MLPKFQNGGKSRASQWPRATLEHRVHSNAATMLLVAVCSTVSCLLFLFGVSFNLFFTAMVPYYLVITGKLGGGPETALYIQTGIALALIALYPVCYLLSKKYPLPGLISGTALYTLDTLAMLYLYELRAPILVEVLFHAIVLWSLISGVIAAVQLKKLPPEDPSAQSVRDELDPDDDSE